ncbi:MAG: PorV/PorQ family protein [Candidatus Marinimicrobia bacterium]|jgi:hypothetical protein|nr:PorV/PorQ family protein [Candidatus Neomarinimicrobiota bacterium]MDP7128702.1 PorV/PorQ family protein [Candidatus Neomarinimicrobiota bacterium]MDP7610086.1 PorV/PorQ family protein [Candidatus Neomarinimicrobiota bacterium]MEE1573226.1 PorV/PorQ family protein [Candidatus Neomarinimicrobiota bacterium]|tara:strand:+ start:1546 stop:2550 length:1005 start_codon:yes stop_codon:yes gene_type:complete
MKKHIFLIILSSYLFSQKNISKVGTTSAQFLKIGVDARATGMGDAFVAIDGDMSNIYWNPSGLASITQSGGIITNSEWLAGIKIYFGSTIFTTPIGNVGLYIQSLSIPEDDVRTVSHPEGTGEKFSSSNLALGISFAKMVSNQFSFGITGKYIQEHIWTMHSNSIALDVGGLYKTDINNLNVGFCISNFGTSGHMFGRANIGYVDIDPLTEGNNELIRARLDGEFWELPLAMRVGISYKQINSKMLSILVAMDAIHPNDNHEHINIGSEFDFSNLVLFRVGYRGIGLQNREGGLAVGVGVKLKIAGSNRLLIDYSYVDYGVLNWVNRLTIGTTF